MPARASHYVVRPGPTTRLPSGMVVQEPGRFVPLIAIDQLPDWLEVVGVPRQLLFSQAVDMIAIGAVARPSDLQIHNSTLANDDVFEVRVLRRHDSDIAVPPAAVFPASPAVSATASSTTLGMAAERATMKDMSTKNTSTPRKAAASDSDAWSRDGSVSSWSREPRSRAGRSATPSNIWTVKSAKTTKPPKASTDMSDRQPCRHWCQTGKCSFKSGCKFSHVMPETIKGLRVVGLSRFPDWYRDQMGLDRKGHGAGLGNTGGKQGRSNSHNRNSSNNKKMGGNAQLRISLASCKTVSDNTMTASAKEDYRSIDQLSEKEWDVAMGEIDIRLSRRSSVTTKLHSNETTLTETTGLAISGAQIPRCQDDADENLMDL
ncbi:zinc finger DNA-binding protein [Grosmannia clavigera kw1407]|uniref:Zinc finger DNA-binding protein n=1 Tax=Grosmannia clavigera (strain kw1407 / UAMH 11150) TaxID=655863 RepID=F0XDR1_GROCL|nr:zinc finger DNA-binding protein [Grosmannia clavigera kw1407]EFX04167.1 zinc finger DNA-binding protein [Grosmannia clavigera kw1407]